MAYSKEIKQAVRGPNKSLGSILGKLAVRHGVSVLDISYRIGATRPTVYAWFRGGNVATFYQNTVENLVKDLRARTLNGEKK